MYARYIGCVFSVKGHEEWRYILLREKKIILSSNETGYFRMGKRKNIGPNLIGKKNKKLYKICERGILGKEFYV